MDSYNEVMQKFNKLQIILMNSNIDKKNIEDCKYKLCDLSKDLDIIKIYVRDLAATAAETITAGQAANNRLGNTPQQPAKAME
jgi:hypothetical protein